MNINKIKDYWINNLLIIGLFIVFIMIANVNNSISFKILGLLILLISKYTFLKQKKLLFIYGVILYAYFFVGIYYVMQFLEFILFDIHDLNHIFGIGIGLIAIFISYLILFVALIINFIKSFKNDQ